MVVNLTSNIIYDSVIPFKRLCIHLYLPVFYVWDIAECKVDPKSACVSAWLRIALGLQATAFAAWRLGSRCYLQRRSPWTILWSWIPMVHSSTCGTAGLWVKVSSLFLKIDEHWWLKIASSYKQVDYIKKQRHCCDPLLSPSLVFHEDQWSEVSRHHLTKARLGRQAKRSHWRGILSLPKFEH